MHLTGALGGPAPLLPAPPRDTPVPGSFALTEDGATRAFDEGAVLLGGSPLRLFRLSGRARSVVEGWRAGQNVGDRLPARLLARRFVSAGAFHPQPTSSEFGPGDVTVVVPVRDRPRQLERLLGALAGLACVVVDDGSADAAATKEACARHGARFIGLAANAGPAAARNAGIAVAGTPLVAFVDSDCVPPEGWLDPLLGHFDDPLVSAVSPRIVAAAPEPGRVVARYEQVRSSLDRGPGPAPVRPGSPVPFVPSAALVVRAEVVRGGGLFDPSLRGGEDVDLVWRLVESGWDVRYVPESVVAHDGATSVGAFLTRRAFYGTTAGPLARRHGDALAPVQASAWSAAVWLLALGRRPVLAATTQAVSVAVLAARLRGLVGEPVPVAWRIAGGGTARSAAPALGGLARAWSPLLVLGLAFGRTRRVCAAALLVPAVHDRAQAPGDLDPVRYAVLHMADDLAYGVGVWMGCVRARTLRPLVPRLVWRARVWSSGALQRSLGTDPQPA